MLDIIFRYDRTAPHHTGPATTADARRLLEQGNYNFAHLLEEDQKTPGPRQLIVPLDLLGAGRGDVVGAAPRQEPFAIVLGCSDARAPTELIFLQGCNDLFVVRVAGNVLGSECLGSIDYARHYFRNSLRLLVVLGHSGCGAVTEAVNAFLAPAGYLALATNHPLRTIVDRLFAPVAAAAQVLAASWGADVVRRPRYRSVLIEMSVVLNAALTASILQHETAHSPGSQLQVVFGYYNLADRRVSLPAEATLLATDTGQVGLVDPPRDQSEFEQLGLRLATCDPVKSALESAQS